MKRRQHAFHSILAPEIERYLAHKRALARRFDCEEGELHLLDRFLADQGAESVDKVTPQLLETFLASRPRHYARSYNHLLGAVRRLFDWLVAQGDAASSPLQAKARRATAQRAPFLFDQTQARRLLELAGKLPDRPRGPLRGPTYRLAFALMYGLGLRVGEVARLTRRDLDFERRVLGIRQTKFSKDRLVPFGPRMEAALREFIELRTERDGPLGPEAPLFSFDGRHAANPYTFTQTFHHLVAELDLTVPPGIVPPRAHHLRHSFAVGTLLRWYRQGIDPNERLQHLSTFLGHVDPDSTAVYLTITSELRQEASARFERFAAPALREMAP
jgi:site-specific recombinase XerD